MRLLKTIAVLYIFLFPLSSLEAQEKVYYANGDTSVSYIFKVGKTSVTHIKRGDPELLTKEEPNEEIDFLDVKRKSSNFLNNRYKHFRNIANRYIGIHLSVSIPFGGYSATSGDQAGYALSGYFLGIEHISYVRPRFGIVLKFYKYANLYNSLTQDAQLRENLTSGEKVEVTYGGWHGSGFGIGAIYSVRKQKFTWDIKALIGNNLLDVPEFSYKYTNTAALYSVEITSPNSSGGGGLFNLGLQGRYDLSEKFSINFVFDFFTGHGSSEVERTIQVIDPIQPLNNSLSTLKETRDQDVLTINFGLGIAMNLKRHVFYKLKK